MIWYDEHQYYLIIIINKNNWNWTKNRNNYIDCVKLIQNNDQIHEFK